MKIIIGAVEAISLYSGKCVAWIIYAGILMLAYEVVARYFFNSPTMWVHGYTQRLFGSYFILIGAYTFINKGHVRIDLISMRFSEKGKKILDMINCAFLIVWSGVMVPFSWNFFMRSYRMNEVDEMVLSHPIWWVKFMIVLGMFLICLQGVGEFLKNTRELMQLNRSS
jgi:TRAP-type mannitol/chloroaromatic compound transport system permease small subunit